jgi:ankyrin repeat protein
LGNNIDFEIKNKLNRIILYWIAVIEKEKFLNNFVCGIEFKRAKINVYNRKSKTILHFTAENNHPEIAHILFKQNADCNIINDDAWTSLYIAAEKDHLNIIKLLSHHGANLNTEIINDITLLYWIIINGRVEIMKNFLN